VTKNQGLWSTLVRIAPIHNFYEYEINQRSADLIEKHATQWPRDRLGQQRHRLDYVPIFEVTYAIGNTEPGRFWVYGTSNHVYMEDFAVQCFCCFQKPPGCKSTTCTIL